jgi:hypothetical protein
VVCIQDNVFAISPTNPPQEMTDNQNDWINMTNKEPTSSGDRSTDILAVNYFSDGKILNATLWLYFPFKDHPTNYNQINYGMLIDADFNINTGYGGLDYLFEIGWRNNTKSWKQELWQLSPTGEQKAVDIKHNYTGFFEKGKAYVVLPLNLSLMHYPTKYRLTFYSESQKGDNDSFLTDFTRAVPLPPLELAITTSPKSLTLRPGENKTIELKVNSTQGYEPVVFLAVGQSGDIKSNIEFNKIRIPSYGVATTPMTIAASKNAVSRLYTLFIFANSTFLDLDLFPFTRPNTNTTAYSLVPNAAGKSQNVISQSTIPVYIAKPPNIIDILGLGTSGVPINIPKEYTIGFYTIVLTFLVPAIARWIYGKRQINYVSKYMTNITSTYDSLHQNKFECEKSLENIRRQVAETFSKGKLNESHYKILNEKIDEYKNKVSDDENGRLE